MLEIIPSSISEQISSNDNTIDILDEIKGHTEKIHNERLNHMQTNYQIVLSDKIEQFNRDILEKEDTIANITREKESVVQEVHRLRGQVERLTEVERLRIDTESRNEFSASILDEDADKILKRINRYRRERDKAEQSLREMKNNLIQAEDQLRIENEKNNILKKELKVLQEETENLNPNVPFKLKMKTLRGGHKDIKQDDTTEGDYGVLDNIYLHNGIRSSYNGGEEEDGYSEGEEEGEEEGDEEGDEECDEEDEYEDEEYQYNDINQHIKHITPTKNIDENNRLHPHQSIKGFNLTELHDDTGIRLKELSARSQQQSGKKDKIKTGFKGLFKSVKGLFS